jgi:non-heme chloroperoxidase
MRHPSVYGVNEATRQIPSASGAISRRITLPTRVEINYVEQGNPEGEALIFLHGLTDSWHSWEPILPLISDAYHTFALSQRGHGDSSKPACCYTSVDFVGDVIAFMDALCIERATLIGHSMGSLVAHHMTVDHPARMQRLVLVGSWATLAGHPAVMEFEAAVQTLEDPIDPAFAYEFQQSTIFNPLPSAFMETVVGESLKVPASVWKQALAGLTDEDHSARLGTIQVDTLILWGDQDTFVSREDQQTLQAAINHARFIPYEATGHSVHWERPEQFVYDLESFMHNTLGRS